MAVPGVGTYGVSAIQCRSFSDRRPVQIMCFLKGGEFCAECSKLLLHDYYKGTRNSWCLECFQEILAKPKKSKRVTGELEKVVKARHCCSFYHQHIGVPGITTHTTTAKQLRRLSIKEKVMWIKYGDGIY